MKILLKTVLISNQFSLRHDIYTPFNNRQDNIFISSLEWYFILNNQTKKCVISRLFTSPKISEYSRDNVFFDEAIIPEK